MKEPIIDFIYENIRMPVFFINRMKTDEPKNPRQASPKTSTRINISFKYE